MNFQQICRLCLSDEIALLPLFQMNDLGEVNLPEKIAKFAAIEILETGGLPDKVCSTCINFVNACFEYKEIIVDSNNALRSFASDGETADEPSLYKKLEQVRERATYFKRVFGNTQPPVDLGMLYPLELKSEIEAQTHDGAVVYRNQTTCSSNSETARPTEHSALEENPMKAAIVKSCSASEDACGWEMDMWLPEDDLPIRPQSTNKTKLKTNYRLSARSKLATKNGAVSRKTRGEATEEKLMYEQVKQHGDGTETFSNHCEKTPPTGKKRGRPRKRPVVATQTIVINTEKSYQCRVCLQSMKGIAIRNQHESEHAPPFKCERCGKLLNSISTFHNHRRIVHLGLTKHKCHYCGMHKASQKSLVIHIRSHTGERPVPCPKCTKTFSCISNLKTHLKFHSGVRTFFCHICGKGHVTVSNLKQHIKSHANERNHVCHVCGRGFNARAGLKRHMICHDEEKRFTCAFCMQQMKRVGSLRRHIVVQHLKLKPYKCDVCFKEFGRRENLRHHCVTLLHNVSKEKLGIS